MPNFKDHLFSIAFFNSSGFQHSVTQKCMDFRPFSCEFPYGSDLSSLSLRKVVLAKDGRQSDILRLEMGCHKGHLIAQLQGALLTFYSM